jgi:putative hydrolase of HD superfamily
MRDGKVFNVLPLLIELQRLKRLDRTGWTLRGLPNGTESVAAHSFGVCVTAMLLADEMKARGVDLDCEQLLRMALVHDWAETRIGDMPKTATQYFGSEVRKQAEITAFADMVAGIRTQASLTNLHQDYEKRDTVEARVVKAADILDLLVQVSALERAGATGLDEFWEVASDADFQLPPAATEVVNELLAKILAERKRVRTSTIE